MTADAAATAGVITSAIVEKTQGLDGAPVIVEGPGRYVVYETPRGDWVIARATGICDTCKGHGCGEQAEPVQVPAMVIQLAARSGKGGQLMGMLKAAAGRKGRHGG